MNDDILPTRPPNPGEVVLRQKFFESIADQDELMSKAIAQMLTLELAIPGIYATVLKFLRGEQALAQVNLAFYVTYAFWMLALVLTLYALIPKDWKVDPTILRQDPKKYAEGLGIEDFFRQAAEHKRRLLIASAIFFFLGVLSVGFSI